MAVIQPSRDFKGLPLIGTLLDRLLAPRRPRLAATWSRDATGRLVRRWGASADQD